MCERSIAVNSDIFDRSEVALYNKKRARHMTNARNYGCGIHDIQK